jgi:sugar lactone lactonase YvrE
MPIADLVEAERLNRHLDAAAGGHGPPQDGAQGLDPRLAWTATYLATRDDALDAAPAFASQLLDELLGSQPLPADLPRPPAIQPVEADHQMGFAPSAPRKAASPEARRRWDFSLLATAALVALTVVGSVFVLAPDRRQQESPAMILAPPAVPDSADGFIAPFAEYRWSATTDPSEPLDGPYNLALDPEGNIWVDDLARNQFAIFAPDGAFLGNWGGPEGGSLLATHPPATGAGSFDFSVESYWMTGLGFDADGNLYVLDAGNFRVQKFGPDRKFLLAWGSNGRDEGQFLTPGALTVDARGQVYVVDFLRHDVQIFDSEGNHLRTLGGFGGGDGEFYFDTGGAVAVAPDGAIWVTDMAQHRVQKFAPDGTFQLSLGEKGYAEGQFTMPGTAAVDGAGRIYVPDWANARIQVFAPDGTFLTAWGPPPGKQLYGPNTIVLDGEGNAYVADDDQHRVVKYRVES